MLDQAAGKAQTNSPSTLLELNQLPFFHGREYFVLRSGRAQMLLQSDRADLGPAFTYLLFDAQDPRQSARKTSAYNWDPVRGVPDSALEVVVGGYPFTALGHRCETRWILLERIPSVEAVWWAGGIRVTERFTAATEGGLFRRSIRLDGRNVVKPEAVILRLHLPPGHVQTNGTVLVWEGRNCRLGLAPGRSQPARLLPDTACLELGPIEVRPNGPSVLETWLLVQIPAEATVDLAGRTAALAGAATPPEISRTRLAWNRTSSINARDQLIAELFDKARYSLPGLIADDGAMDAGMLEYGAQWVRDTSNTALGALHAGHFELVRAALVRILTTMISKEGVTMIANSFEAPDLEQFDQMGELLHLLKAYRDWTGDDSLIREHRELLLALIERPLSPQFRDATGMVHNRREFWERTFEDAYELAYQTYVIQGLRDAAALAEPLGAADRASRWRAEADRILQAVLNHPERALVDQTHLIKRRNVTGQVAATPGSFKGFAPDVPLNTEQGHRLEPDASTALPIALGIVPPESLIVRGTLDFLEQLWNTRWSDGGYDRYHTSGQPDQPGPWPFATCFILRAQHEAGLYDRSRRSLEWLNTMAGGRAGLWFEEIPSVRSTAKGCGLVAWTSGEVALFMVRHYLGVRFEGDQMIIRPALFPGSEPISADLRYRQARLQLQIDGSGPIVSAGVNGTSVKPDAQGFLRLPPDFAGGTVTLTTLRVTAKP